MKNPLQKEFDQLHTYLEKGDIQNSDISQKGIYWHVDHCLRILEGVPEALRTSKKEEFNPKTNLTKLVIMNFKWIPRGKGKSPKHVLPDADHLSKIEIEERADRAFHQVNSIAKLPAWSHFRHPLFGSLNLKETVKFLKIHTNHHLKIMRDIVK
ncbi:hypothetical protein [Nonlabens marinus]|uniref:DinB-like domain-containing protein n=1 Tax=Nonlabens marinus S1-08 TaxID=1454201 RepID=W8VTW2_9FLAO|nr:hypothetical protein [Nonlabens marinus]BAO54053.1 hypothetical protein NMS_0044 [Nonlabens marinus S1-08]